MLPRNFAVLATLGALWLASASYAQEKTDKVDEQAKAVAEQFTKSFLVEKNADSAMKLVAVPFFLNVSAEDFKIVDIHNIDTLKKHFSMVLDKKPQAIKGLVIKKVSSGETVLADARITREMREALEKGLKKTDRVVDLRTPARDDGSFAEVRVLVASRDGQAKVVGYGMGFAGPSKGKK
jgi:hypothetical protein